MSSAFSPPRVAFIQPYIAEYRIPLFSAVVSQLADLGIDCRFFYASQGPAGSKSDAKSPTWAFAVPGFSPAVGGITFNYRRLPPGWHNASVVVTELEAANLNAWGALVRGRNFVLFGHGKNYAEMPRRLAILAESILCKRANRLLVYMPSGRDALIQAGVSYTNIDIFYNTVETIDATAAYESLSDDEVISWAQSRGVPVDKDLAGFVGSLEPGKQIPLLLETGQRMEEIDTSKVIVVAGDGALAPDVARFAQSHSSVVPIGRISTYEFGILARLVRVLINPGRVGLLAVQAKALGLPIITATGALHGPEIEYLVEPGEFITTEPNPESLVAAWQNIAAHRVTATAGAVPSVEESARRITESIVKALSDEARKGGER